MFNVSLTSPAPVEERGSAEARGSAGIYHITYIYIYYILHIL